MCMGCIHLYIFTSAYVWTSVNIYVYRMSVRIHGVPVCAGICKCVPPHVFMWLNGNVLCASMCVSWLFYPGGRRPELLKMGSASWSFVDFAFTPNLSRLSHFNICQPFSWRYCWPLPPFKNWEREVSLPRAEVSQALRGAPSLLICSKQIKHLGSKYPISHATPPPPPTRLCSGNPGFRMGIDQVESSSLWVQAGTPLPPPWLPAVPMIWPVEDAL